MGPAERAERPECAAEPGIQHVFFRYPAIAFRCLLANVKLAIGAMPGRDAMPPPQLAADTPVFDVFHPVKIHPLEALRHNLDVALAHRRDGFLGQRLNLQEPLCADEGFDNFATTLAAGHGCA